MTFKRSLLVALLLASGAARADDFEVPSLKLFDDGDAVRIHPSTSRAVFGRAFSAFSGGSLSFDDTVRRAMSVKTGAGVAAKGRANGKGLDYKFFVEDVPVCGYQVRAAELKGREVMALGRAPRLKHLNTTTLADWPQPERALDVAATQLAGMVDGKAVAHSSADRCYVVRDGALYPAWKFQLVVDGRPYLALADEGRVYQLDRQFFDLEGANVYAENEVATPARLDVALPGLVGATLETEFLKTTVTSGYTQASESSRYFNYPTSDDRFDEVSAFTHAFMHFKFFTDLGFSYYDLAKPLLIEVHKPPQNSQNNALFTPSVGGGAPRITIGNGDGVGLKNLNRDGDVVSHELGHLVIFQYLIATSGPSLVLHEGLADFFAFAQTGNACLGESICPSGSNICMLPEQCLRSGELSVKYDDDQWKEWSGTSGKLGHLHGQVISGMLWDLYKSGVMPLPLLSRTVMKAVSYLPESATFDNFIDGMIVANNEISGSKYDAEIRQAVTARGMAEFLPDGIPVKPGDEDPTDTTGKTGGTVDDDAPAAQAPAPATKPEERPTPGSEDKKKKKSSPVSCGAIAAEAARKAPDYAGALMLLILALPLIYPITSARASSSRGKRG